MNTDELQALMNELAEERKLRQGLEERVNAMTLAAEDAARQGAIRSELQKLGVAKVDLAFRAVREDLKQATGEQVREYLTKFVAENPELLPARISGGSGATSGSRGSAPGGGIDLDKIRPGMSAEELDRVRQEIARVASQTLRGGW